MTALLSLQLLLAGCALVSQKAYDTRLDQDGDGISRPDDCDDADATVGAVTVLYTDGDGDGFGAGKPWESCGPVATTASECAGGVVANDGDCDDLDGAVNPDAQEICDGLDNNCDRAVDMAGGAEGTVWYFDADGDGYGAPEVTSSPSCDPPAGYVGTSDDCDDEIDAVNPGAVDPWYDGLDEDCAGNDDYDLDGDGFHTDDDSITYGPTDYAPGTGVLPGDDCNDSDASYYPDAPDAWYDGNDENCDGADDFDQDGDGYDAVDGGEGDDCDDTNASVFGRGTEHLGDDSDSDCDGDNNRFNLLPLDGITWTGAGQPVFAANSESVYLSVPASQITLDSGSYYDSAAAIRWTKAIPDFLDSVQMWNSNTTNPSTFNVGGPHGFTVDDNYAYGVLSLELSSGHGMRLVRYDLSSGSRDAVNIQSSESASYADLSLVQDGETLLAAGADDDGNVTFARVDDIPTGNYAVNHEESAEVSRIALTLSGAVPLYGASGVDLLALDFDPLGPEEAFGRSTLASGSLIPDLDMADDLGYPLLVEALTDDSVIRLYDVTTGATTEFSASQVADVSLARSEESGSWYLAWSDGAGDVHLSFGPDLGALATLDWDLPDSSAQVACWSAAGVVWMAVVADGTVTVGQLYE